MYVCSTVTQYNVYIYIISVCVSVWLKFHQKFVYFSHNVCMCVCMSLYTYKRNSILILNLINALQLYNVPLFIHICISNMIMLCNLFQSVSIYIMCVGSVCVYNLWWYLFLHICVCFFCVSGLFAKFDKIMYLSVLIRVKCNAVIMLQLIHINNVNLKWNVWFFWILL